MQTNYPNLALSNPRPTRPWLRLMTGIAVFTAGWLNLTVAIADDSDWPQWRGPARDGQAAPQSLLKSWPKGGPKLLWSYREAGLGYSTVSVGNGRLYTLGQRGEDCVAICLDPKTGKEIWAQRFDRGTVKGDYLTEWGGGPRSSPTVDGDLVYFFSDLGELACLRTKDGSKVWSVNVVNDLGGKIPQWGYSESVLIDGDRVVVTPGGDNFMVAFNKKTGDQVWTSKGLSEGAQYVSIMTANVGGIPLYITACKKGLVTFNAKTGDLQFISPKTGNGTAVIPTPIVRGNEIYHSSAYGAGNTLLSLAAEDGTVTMNLVYHFAKESMENHHGGYVFDNGTIFGFSNDLKGVWMAQDWKTGEVLWSKDVGNSNSGSIAMADGLLYCYDDSEGVCYLAEPSKEGWKELGQLKLPEQTATERGRGAIWAHPVIANQTLFIRDQDLIYAFDIGK